METKRQKQLGALLKRNMAEVMFRDTNYLFGGAMVTVTDVKMTSDLGIAKVYLSVFATEDKDSIVEICNKNMVALRHSLAKKIRNKVRRVPNIAFYIDETLDEMYKLNELFDSIEDGSEEE